MDHRVQVSGRSLATTASTSNQEEIKSSRAGVDNAVPETRCPTCWKELYEETVTRFGLDLESHSRRFQPS